MGCAVGRALESIFPLADSVVLSFGHCPPQERHALCEHLLSDERVFSAACRMNKLRYPVIRVQRRVRNWQIPHSQHSGIKNPQQNAADSVLRKMADRKREKGGRFMPLCYWRRISMAAICGGKLAVMTPLWMMQTISPGAYSRAAGVFT